MGIAALALGAVALGAGASIYGDVSKGSPPTYSPLSAAQIQGESVASNLSSLPSIENLASQSNSFSIDQVQKMLQLVIPGYNNITTGVASNINSLLNGQIPADVQQQIQSSDAAKALTGGFGGSGIAGNLTARDLGLTSLNLTQSGISSAQSWLSTMANINEPAMFNLSSMFLNPNQVAGFDAGQSQLQYQSELNQYNQPNAAQMIGGGLESLGGLGLGLLAGSGNLGTSISSLFGGSGTGTTDLSSFTGNAYPGFGLTTPTGTGSFTNTVGPGGAGSNIGIDFNQMMDESGF